MRDRSWQRTAVRALVAGAFAILSLEALAPARSEAMCCLCRGCSGGSFCVDGLGTSLDCANFCVGAGCPNTTFDAMDICAGGCDGAPEEPTATPSSTATASPSASPSITPTNTPTPLVTHTPSATPTITPTASPSQTPVLGGAIRYYVADRPVANAEVALFGAGAAKVITDASGHYGFPTVSNTTHSIEPAKQGEFNAAVTAFDASLVLQKVAGLETFNANQSLACDVTGDGTVSALDATRILQFQADLLERFAVADQCGSDWAFRPMPAPAANQSLVQPLVSGFVCQQGAINYDPFVAPAAGQDFIAVLFGDCSGNWMP